MLEYHLYSVFFVNMVKVERGDTYYSVYKCVHFLRLNIYHFFKYIFWFPFLASRKELLYTLKTLRCICWQGCVDN